jgi:DtxR family Mn-dependent transcriptional regulator
MTTSEENYIKVIYHLSQAFPIGISTNSIAKKTQTKPSSVSDMLKKLSEKNVVIYKKYQGVTLTERGFQLAKMIVRKHRLWEVFLVEKLSFSWDEVHDIAEQLEHIKSETLVNRLDKYLGYPSVDPHGDPIPNENGEITKRNKLLLSEALVNQSYQCVGVKNSASDFLQYLNKNNIKLGTTFIIKERELYDNTLLLEMDSKLITVSNKIATNLYVQ